MTTAARVRRHRERARAGKAVIQVAVAWERWADVLLEAKLLKEWDAEDDAAFIAAFEYALDLRLDEEERRLGLRSSGSTM